MLSKKEQVKALGKKWENQLKPLLQKTILSYANDSVIELSGASIDIYMYILFVPSFQCDVFYNT